MHGRAMRSAFMGITVPENEEKKVRSSSKGGATRDGGRRRVELAMGARGNREGVIIFFAVQAGKGNSGSNQEAEDRNEEIRKSKGEGKSNQ